MDEIEWLMSAEQREHVEPMLLRALTIAPGWLRAMSVRFDPNEEDTAAITVRSEYRMAHLRVGDAFFSDTKAEQPVTLIHEVVHIHVGQLSAVFSALLEAATEADSPLRKWAKEQWRLAEETVACDLTAKINRILPPAGNT